MRVPPTQALDLQSKNIFSSRKFFLKELKALYTQTSKCTDANANYQKVLDFQTECNKNINYSITWLGEVSSNAGIKDTDYRSFAISILGGLKNSFAVPVLINLIEEEDNPKIREAAIYSLYSFSDFQEKKDLILLILKEHLRDPEFSVQQAATRTLWHFKGREAVKALNDRLKELGRNHPLRKEIENVLIIIEPYIGYEIIEKLQHISKKKEPEVVNKKIKEIVQPYLDFCGVEMIQRILSRIALGSPMRYHELIQEKALIALRVAFGDSVSMDSLLATVKDFEKRK